MKQTLLLTLFIAFGIFSLNAQNYSFEYVNSSSNTFVLDKDRTQDIAIKGILTNHTSAPLEIQWIREEVYLSDDWETAICDPIRCYLPFVSAQSFSLPANDTAILDAHLYPNRTEGDSAILNVSIIDQSNPDDTMVVGYSFYQESASPTNRYENVDVVLYPNPASSYFRVKSDVVIGSVEIYDILGKQIKSVHSTATTAYVNVVDLMKGIYIVRIKDNRGGTLKTQRLRKELP